MVTVQESPEDHLSARVHAALQRYGGLREYRELTLLLCDLYGAYENQLAADATAQEKNSEHVLTCGMLMLM